MRKHTHFHTQSQPAPKRGGWLFPADAGRDDRSLPAPLNLCRLYPFHAITFLNSAGSDHWYGTACGFPLKKIIPVVAGSDFDGCIISGFGDEGGCPAVEQVTRHVATVKKLLSE